LERAFRETHVEYFVSQVEKSWSHGGPLPQVVVPAPCALPRSFLTLVQMIGNPLFSMLLELQHGSSYQGFGGVLWHYWINVFVWLLIDSLIVLVLLEIV
jgi:hypothetical protein